MVGRSAEELTALARDLAEIEGSTSARLNAQFARSNLFPSARPHAHFVNAAFAYWRPRERNRFNDAGFGAWYAAFETDTAIAEVTFHIARELERVQDWHATVEWSEMWASFAGAFVDLLYLHTRARMPPSGYRRRLSGRERGGTSCPGSRAQRHRLSLDTPVGRHLSGRLVAACGAVRHAGRGDPGRVEWRPGTNCEHPLATPRKRSASAPPYADTRHQTPQQPPAMHSTATKPGSPPPPAPPRPWRQAHDCPRPCRCCTQPRR